MAKRASWIIGFVAADQRTDSKRKKKSNIKNNVILAIGLICILHRYLENFKFEPVFFFFNFIVIILFIGSAIFNVHLWVKLIFSKDDALIL